MLYLTYPNMKCIYIKFLVQENTLELNIYEQHLQRKKMNGSVWPLTAFFCRKANLPYLTLPPTSAVEVKEAKQQLFKRYLESYEVSYIEM